MPILDASTTPVPDADSRPFWDYTSQRELRVQQCSECGYRRFPPAIMCPECQSFQAEWVRLSGRGTVYSWEVIHHQVLPVFMDLGPLPLVLVEPEEQPGLRFLGRLLDCPTEQMRIGLPVEAVFEDAAPGITLVQWRPRA